MIKLINNNLKKTKNLLKEMMKKKYNIKKRNLQQKSKLKKVQKNLLMIFHKNFKI